MCCTKWHAFVVYSDEYIQIHARMNVDNSNGDVDVDDNKTNNNNK